MAAVQDSACRTVAPYRFAWTLVGAPAGSQARLSGADALGVSAQVSPGLLPDVDGDYAVQHPDPPHDENGGGNTMRANIRYTDEQLTLIARGQGPVVQAGREQYRELCQMLIEREEFAGRDFSWGDAIIEDCAGDSAARSVAESLIASLKDPMILEGRQLTLSASIGIAMYPADGQNASQLRRNADQVSSIATCRTVSPPTSDSRMRSRFRSVSSWPAFG